MVLKISKEIKHELIYPIAGVFIFFNIIALVTTLWCYTHNEPLLGTWQYCEGMALILSLFTFMRWIIK
jgi:hypothetical protein